MRKTDRITELDKEFKELSEEMTQVQPDARRKTVAATVKERIAETAPEIQAQLQKIQDAYTDSVESIEGRRPKAGDMRWRGRRRGRALCTVSLITLAVALVLLGARLYTMRLDAPSALAGGIALAMLVGSVAFVIAPGSHDGAELPARTLARLEHRRNILIGIGGPALALRDHVPNEFIRVNPLGLQVSYFRVDQAFEEGKQ